MIVSFVSQVAKMLVSEAGGSATGELTLAPQY